MEHIESEHYIFNFEKGTTAERDIASIATYQERCFSSICNVLGVTPKFKIEYFLCNSPKDVGRIYGDNEACNGFVVPPNKIYAVYNESIKCIGFHEDAHLISYIINQPDCPAIKEGLAMYFDQNWWGISNNDWTKYYIKTERYVPIERLLDKDYFFSQDCTVTYPIMGAFTEWLIAVYGIEQFLEMYRGQNIEKSMNQVYRKSSAELNREFLSFLRLSHIDETVEREMEAKLARK